MRLQPEAIYLLLVSFFGLIVGAFLIFKTLEEYKPGKIAFKWVKRIILLVLIIALLTYTKTLSLTLAGIILGFLVAIFIGEYLFLGLAMLISFVLTKQFTLFIASLVFLFGLPYGSLELRFYKIRKNILLRKIYYNFILYVIPLFLLLSISFIRKNIDFLIGLSAGAFFNYMLK